MEHKNLKNRLIVALDTDDGGKIDWITEDLKDTVSWVKIGFQALASLGTEIFLWMHERKFQCFLDLKFHDIPNTVARDVGTMTEHGASMINMHASGGIEMMQAARESANAAAKNAKKKTPILLGVTILTSMDEDRFQSNFGSERKITEQVVYLAEQAKAAGLDGVVASPLEIEPIRQACGDKFLIVTPGIRPTWSDVGDQRRFTTPSEAISMGTDYIVVGRPIIKADDPLEAAERILDEMEGSKK
ncbi:orotidine-5'-phosphate decarboxylase [Candidatus Poribacteria bacterium]|nr:orotidine-5'-phosphate decarboxylase [Candidatus Poribacteria bacterium]MYB63448.1 orotidine-5'-phosphate decarboxylase [Candidatus Poribacteria bacterium]MYF55762.1 orotidine-5'-phosphate decarboxylase [Candidatus Poribacteria bacterium]MYI94891.1 orotidine-5'-phosphate decarboxylase [Candidatus Poribacteria bacterium]